jgi:hypothetical protein
VRVRCLWRMSLQSVLEMCARSVPYLSYLHDDMNWKYSSCQRHRAHLSWWEGVRGDSTRATEKEEEA